MGTRPKVELRQIPIRSEIDFSGLKRWVKDVIIPQGSERDRRNEFPWELYRELHQQGWLQAFLPIEYGGQELSMIDLAVMCREIAYGSAGIFSSTVANILSLTALIHFGKSELKQKILDSFAKTFAMASYCMTEDETGSDITQTKTRAARVAGGYILNGRKDFITNASYAEHFVVYANLEGVTDRRRSLCAFYVSRNSTGLTPGETLMKLGQRDSNTSSVQLKDVFVPEVCLLGREGDGLKINFKCLQRSKTLIGAGAVGVCDRSFDLVTRFLENRVLYGRPLIEVSAIQHFLAQLQTEAEAAWLLVCRASAQWDTGDFAVKEASMAKMFGANIAAKFTSEALELFGGRGYLQDYEIERLYRDAKVMEIYEGPTLIQEMLIARELFPDFWTSTADANEFKKKAS